MNQNVLSPLEQVFHQKFASHRAHRTVYGTCIASVARRSPILKQIQAHMEFDNKLGQKLYLFCLFYLANLSTFGFVEGASPFKLAQKQILFHPFLICARNFALETEECVCVCFCFASHTERPRQTSVCGECEARARSGRRGCDVKRAVSLLHLWA